MRAIACINAIALLQFSTRLLDAVSESTTLTTEKHDPDFLEDLLDAGKTYSVLLGDTAEEVIDQVTGSQGPGTDTDTDGTTQEESSGVGPVINSFLDTLWVAKDETVIQTGKAAFNQFIGSFESAKQGAKFLNNTFKTADQVSTIKEDSNVIRNFLGLASGYAQLKPGKFSDANESNDFFLKSIWDNQVPQGIDGLTTGFIGTLLNGINTDIFTFDHSAFSLPSLVTGMINISREVIEQEFGLSLTNNFIQALTEFSATYSLLMSARSEDGQESDFFLYQLWEVVKNPINGLSDFLNKSDAVDTFKQGFSDFLGDLKNTPEHIADFIRYSTKVLLSLSRSNSLFSDENSSGRNLEFIDGMLELSRTYFQASLSNDFSASTGFFSRVFRGDPSDEIFDYIGDGAASIAESVRILWSEAQDLFEPDDLEIDTGFKFPGSNNPNTLVGKTIQALKNSDYDNIVLSQYQILNVLDNEATSAQDMILVSTEDNTFLGNTSYAYGQSFGYVSGDEETGEPAYTYPYILIFRHGELEYFPVNSDYQIYPGDKILLPTPPIDWDGTYTPPAESKAIFLNDLLIDSFIGDPLGELMEVGQFFGDFVVGALYEFILNEVDSLEVMFGLIYNLTSIATGEAIGAVPMGYSGDLIDNYLEARLPQTAAFYMGRVAGSAAGLVAAYYKALIGAPLAAKGIAVTTTVGSSVGATKEGLLLGSAFAGAIVTNATASAYGALESGLENTAILMAMSNGKKDFIKFPGARGPEKDTDLGTWEGTRLDSKIRIKNPEKYGLPEGSYVEYKKGRVDFSQYSQKTYEKVPGLTGNHSKDRSIIHRHIAEKEGFLKSDGTPNSSAAEDWLKQQKLTAHHARDCTVELIPTSLHKIFRHTGAAYDIRTGVIPK